MLLNEIHSLLALEVHHGHSELGYSVKDYVMIILSARVF